MMGTIRLRKLMTKRSSVADYLPEFESHGTACAYVQHRGYRPERWSYRAIAEMAFRFAGELKGRNIGKGDRLMLWGENSAQWVAAFFGCAIGGVVVAPMDDGASPDFATRVFHQVDAKLLVCSQEHAQKHSSHIVQAASTLTFEDLPRAVERHPSSL